MYRINTDGRFYADELIHPAMLTQKATCNSCIRAAACKGKNSNACIGWNDDTTPVAPGENFDYVMVD